MDNVRLAVQFRLDPLTMLERQLEEELFPLLLHSLMFPNPNRIHFRLDPQIMDMALGNYDEHLYYLFLALVPFQGRWNRRLRYCVRSEDGIPGRLSVLRCT